MPEDLHGRSLVKFASLALGILIGGSVAPLIRPASLNVATSATAGSFLGAILGYFAGSGLVFYERWRRDRELLRACDAVRIEARLPASIGVKVHDGHVTLEGEGDNPSLRSWAGRAMSNIPGVRSVSNQIKLRPVGGVGVTPGEIRRRILESLVKHAEEEAHAIAVIVDESRVVLEGTVDSPAEAAVVEGVAWDVPGVAEVENHLKFAA